MSEKLEILDALPFSLDSEDLLKGQTASSRAAFQSLVEDVVRTVNALARPKAIYTACPVTREGNDGLSIGGIRFEGRIASKLLDRVEIVFPFIATCGREVDQIPIPLSGLAQHYWLDLAKTAILDSAISYLRDHLVKKYGLRGAAKISPGSATGGFPIERQRELFSIFGKAEALIGVALTNSLLMVPLKSESGIYFETEAGLEDCELCPLESCYSRKQPYASWLCGKREFN
ncbi:MAG: hypothetical protein HYX90_11805 [Chloroflexi bacterium]|nr:hypothetical protein [Chloroflexota bacterium]